MRIQIFVGGLLCNPGCDVGADFLVIIALVDWPITNKVLVNLFKILSSTLGVDWEYFVRHVIATLLASCFVQLSRDFMVDESLPFS